MSIERIPMHKNRHPFKVLQFYLNLIGIFFIFQPTEKWSIQTHTIEFIRMMRCKLQCTFSSAAIGMKIYLTILYRILLLHKVNGIHYFPLVILIQQTK